MVIQEYVFTYLYIYKGYIYHLYLLERDIVLSNKIMSNLTDLCLITIVNFQIKKIKLIKCARLRSATLIRRL